MFSATRKQATGRIAVTYLAALTGFASVLPRPAASCPQCASPFKPGTYTGEAKRVGNGVAYSWVTLDAKGKPASVGVTLTETALEGLNQIEPQSFAEMERDMFMLMLPKQAMKTAFDHISLDWNAKGHPPMNVYDKPHFDIHFYTLTQAEREKITAIGPDVAVCRKTVPGGYTPAGYVYAPGTEAPQMGGHWIDPKAPELNGKPFGSTFIYGSYNGKLAFVEPMVTKAFLDSKEELNVEIPVPTVYAKSAYYPTRYVIHHDAVRHEVTIALDGMVWREGTNKTSPKAPTTKTAPAVLTSVKPAAKPTPTRTGTIASKAVAKRD